MPNTRKDDRPAEIPYDWNSSFPYVFISYSHNNTSIAEAVIQKIQQYQINFWWDDKLQGGVRWGDELMTRIEHRIGKCCQQSAYSGDAHAA